MFQSFTIIHYRHTTLSKKWPMRLYLTVKLGENVYIYITLIEEYKKVNSKNLLKFNVKINKSFIEV